MKNILISGPDGTGKSTIVKSLCSVLKSKNVKTSIVWLRFNHYFARIVNFFGRVLNKSYYETFAWGKIGYHDYDGIIGYFYIFAVFLDHLIFITFIKKFHINYSSDKLYVIDRYIVDVMADLIVDTKKTRLIILIFNRFFYSELKKFNVFILKCPKNLVLERRSDIKDDKKYVDKIIAYKLLSRFFKIKTINTGEYSPNEVTKIICKQ